MMKNFKTFNEFVNESYADPLEGFPQKYKDLLKKLQRSNDRSERYMLINKMNVIRKKLNLKPLQNESVNEGLKENDYTILGQNEMNGEALSRGESKKFHKLLTDKVKSQTEFQYSESNDDDTEHYYINSNNDEIGISIVQKKGKYFWKTVVSDKKLQDGSVIDNGSDRNLNNVIDDIFEFIMSVDDLSRNA